MCAQCAWMGHKCELTGERPTAAALVKLHARRCCSSPGVQNVDAAWPLFLKIRPSRAIWLPVACHSERLKLHELVMGRTVLLPAGSLSEYPTPGPLMPCVANRAQQAEGT